MPVPAEQAVCGVARTLRAEDTLPAAVQAGMVTQIATIVSRHRGESGMMTGTLHGIVSGIVLSLWSVGEARAVVTMVDLGTLPGFTDSVAVAVSDGLVVGQVESNDRDRIQHAFSWTAAGGMMDLGTLGGNRSAAVAVSHGQVVGWAKTNDGSQHAFSWTRAGGMMDLGTLPGGSSSEAIAVDNCQVVGWAGTSNGDQHAFSWTQAGGMVDLGTLSGFTDSVAVAVSDGQAVGYASTSGDPSRAFSWTAAGGMIDLGTLPGFSNSTASAVSDGQVVGQAETSDGGRRHAVLWTVGSCVGDCTQDGAVTINELIQGVNISLGSSALAVCPSFDSNGDGEVAVNELLQGVNAALNGCAG